MPDVKLALIGGGGVRAPLFVASAVRRAERIGLSEICLMDVDEEKLRVFGSLCREAAREAGSDVRITSTTTPREALEGAGYAVTTVRVGGEHGRVLDERIALKHGVLGQETTGPGGFAMAMRSIPAILGYAELLEEVSPGAWLFNFTNPAGLVTQALRDAGFARTVGICDSANLAQHAVADRLGVHPNSLRPEVFGLNHLSWVRRVLLDGQDELAPLLFEPGFVSENMQRFFDEPLRRRVGMWMNEYLYYFHYAEKALEGILADEKTRGEEIEEMNRRLLGELSPLAGPDPASALDAYRDYDARRHAGYMHYAEPEDAEEPATAGGAVGVQEERAPSVAEVGEGYAGVALGIMEALETGEPLYTALNVANEDSISCMRGGDVVEVSCVADSGGVRPLPIGEVPEPQELLMRSVKRYERLAVEAIRTRSRETAAFALMAHPLVLSYSRATALVDGYLEAHAPCVGEWT